MHNSICVVAVFALASLLTPFTVHGQKELAKSPKILSAKSVSFANQTGNDAVGAAALAQLKKMGTISSCPRQERSGFSLFVVR
jgi:hypothetical protein